MARPFPPDDRDHLIEDVLETAKLIDLLPQGIPCVWGNAQAFHPDTGLFYVTVRVGDTLPVGEALVVRSDGVLLPYARHTI